MPKMRRIVFYHILRSRADESDQFDCLRNKQPSSRRRRCQVVEIRNDPLKELQLFPWEITKVLTARDLQFIPGLELGREQVEGHILKHVDSESASLMLNSKERIPIKIYDIDTKTQDHYVSLGRCSNNNKNKNNNKNFCLQGGWYKNFVHRRGLKAGMQIGMYWDTRTSTFTFSVLDEIVPESSETTSKDTLGNPSD